MLELFDLEPVSRAAASLGPVADELLAHLRDMSLTADELVRASGVDAGEGSAALMELELAGRVTLEDGVYRAAI